MFPINRLLRKALIAFVALSLPLAAINATSAADMPAPAPSEQAVPVLSASDFLDRSAMLMTLRLRFAAMLEDEVRAEMRARVAELDESGPSENAAIGLRHDLTAEIYYYVINLKYLIMAEGAIWPEDKPARTYRNDALSELAAVMGELATGDVLVLDIDRLLHRLETVNAWTEGFSWPEFDWFDPAVRQGLVDKAVEAVNSVTRT